MTPQDDIDSGDTNIDFGQTIRGFVDGQKVFGRYTLQRIVGRGGMGVVWLAMDESLGEEVALKFLPEAVRMDASAVDELKRETRKSRRSVQLGYPSLCRRSPGSWQALQMCPHRRHAQDPHSQTLLKNDEFPTC